MNAHSHENLKVIRFAEELLPKWAQLLDVAAQLSPVPEDTLRWFSRFTARSGVEDASTVIEHCRALRACLCEHRDFITAELQRSREDAQPAQILGGWSYALDTMILTARTRMTCPWTIEGTEDEAIGDSDDGDITLRRV